MNKNSFLDALRNIFKKARVADVESIIEVDVYKRQAINTTPTT